VREAFLAGAGEPEVMEAISVAVWMGGTAAAAHGAHAREAARQMQEEWVAMPLVLRPA